MDVSKNESHAQSVIAKVTSWDGVTLVIGRRGEWSFKVGDIEIGQLHGESAALFTFEPELRARLMRAGRVVDHPLYPNRDGPAVRRILSAEDAKDTVRLLRLNYDRAVGARFRIPAWVAHAEMVAE
ncbi:MAG: DUF5519 family protein [Rhizobiaceae bacterium]|nr:DUF5519 family protein [Rhizobiaceae bacterium]